MNEKPETIKYKIAFPESGSGGSPTGPVAGMGGLRFKYPTLKLKIMIKNVKMQAIKSLILSIIPPIFLIFIVGKCLSSSPGV
ncbi:hypothetical protein [Paenibacillus sp. BR1-192]|uniref:hypothetical protein n=1 Tax=Paenibacillus sp. BR1-192 TaxID=3032287 RepID=UPI00240E3B63|nr:hypothetical protein [Paenibacillus sp. BR1-192]WFB59742.1 hypothetical protein P0X86_05770 [Paenibacillus sp. BR1-192]